MRDEERMIYWLAQVAKDARIEAERKQVHIGAAADVDQSVIARFERGKTWPRELDSILSGYEQDLGLEPLSIWFRALELRGQWQAGEAVEDIETLAQSGKENPEAGLGEAG